LINVAKRHSGGILAPRFLLGLTIVAWAQKRDLSTSSIVDHT
jgi:hypothetical protein